MWRSREILERHTFQLAASKARDRSCVSERLGFCACDFKNMCADIICESVWILERHSLQLAELLPHGENWLVVVLNCVSSFSSLLIHLCVSKSVHRFKSFFICNSLYFSSCYSVRLSCSLLFSALSPFIAGQED